MKNIRAKIRKIVAGRAEIRPIRESSVKQGHLWVEMYVTNLVGFRKYGDMQRKIVDDLRAAGIPAETGHYANEVSFFLPASNRAEPGGMSLTAEILTTTQKNK